jgi:preprotein translocase subunit YajC
MILAQAQAGPDSRITILLMFGLLAIMYLLVWRPQQKQMKDQQNMLSALKKGDRVVTSGGLLGKVYVVADKVVTLELLGGTKVEVLKSAISSKMAAPEEAAKGEGAQEKREEK